MAAIATIARADPVGKWRIEIGSHADNAGVITLWVSPEGGTRVDGEKIIVAKGGADKVARAVRESLKVSFGEAHHVETDDGEDVVIGRKGKSPRIDVTLAGSTLTGLEVKIGCE